MISMIILLMIRVLLSVPVQIGMKRVKKITSIFLNLEKSNKKKSCVRNIVTSELDLLNCFIWNGKDHEVRRHALISDFEMGGLKMLDSDSMISAKRVICLKNFLEDYVSTWKTILDKFLSPVGGRFVLHRNFHTFKFKICLPEYYKECFDAWSDLNGKTSSCYREIINELIWNNQFLCYDKKINVRKGHSKFRFCKDRRFNLGKHFLSVWYYLTCKSRTKIFPHEYYQFNFCRTAFCSESFY